MRTLSAFALVAFLLTVVAAAPRQAVQNPLLDPAALHFTAPGSIPWVHDPVGADTAVVAGDPKGAGWYVMLVRWPPHHMSQPHWHEHDRYITVLSGTWWVGTGSRFAPGRTVPMSAGSVVTHFARHAHFDGAKDATCILEIVGQGPDTAHPAASLPAAPEATGARDGASPESLLAALNATISGPAGHRDWARFRALWLPGARIQFAGSGRNGQANLRTLSPEDYIRQDDPYFVAHDFYETTLVKHTERFGNIAQIWTSFALRHSPSGPAAQRGVESCQFLFDGHRWWIANLLDQPESPAHPLPSDLAGK